MHHAPCSLKHLPGFIEKGEEIKAKGVDTIACISVNDGEVPHSTHGFACSVDEPEQASVLVDGI